MAAGIYKVTLDLRWKRSEDFDDQDVISVSAENGEIAVEKAKAHFLSKVYDADVETGIKEGDAMFSGARLAELSLEAKATI